MTPTRRRSNQAKIVHYSFFSIFAHVSASVTARLNTGLLGAAFPDDVTVGQDFMVHLNPTSLEVVKAQLEQSLANAAVGAKVQFERLGYFSVDK